MKPFRRQHSDRSLRFEPLEIRLALAGTGLTGQYFHNADFTGLAAERVEAVDFNWGGGAPALGVQADSFSVRWTGQVEANFTETYAFSTTSDEGVRLWINGQLLVDNWNPHSAAVNTGSMALEAGKRYDVRLDYFDGLGLARIRLQWASASQPLEVIHVESLYASPQGLRGEYSDSLGGSATRVDARIDFDWNGNSPALGISADNFQVQWAGYLRPDHSDLYEFSTLSDDGVRVWIGNELVIDNWATQPPTAGAGAKTLEAGKWYDIRVEYFNGVGDAEVELAWSSSRQTGAGVFEVIETEHLRAARHAPLVATNPLGPGQDPFVIQWEDSYLHVRSSGTSVWIDRADRLEDIHPNDPASTSVRAWQAPGGTSYSHQIWAPELHRINDKWYIYVAASDGNNAAHRMYVLERDAVDPMGPYTFKGKIAASTDRWAIDGTVLQWQNQLYFIWSGWPGFSDGQQNLYIAAMSNPWTISGNRVLLSSPTFAWEQHGLAINEGPQVLIHDGQLHIIYSGSGYWRHEYALGRLTYDGAGSLLDANNWSKSPTPVFQRAGAIVGTGHASFTKSPDGTEDWIVYHAHHDANNWQDNRDILIQPFTYFSDGTPNFGSPIATSVRQEVPSGHADADRPLLPGDLDASATVTAADLNVWRAQFAQEIFPGAVVDGADFLRWQRSLGATAAPAASATAENVSVATAAAFADPRVVAGLTSAVNEVVVADVPPRSLPYTEVVDAAFSTWRPRLESTTSTPEGSTLQYSATRLSKDEVDDSLAEELDVGLFGAFGATPEAVSRRL